MTGYDLIPNHFLLEQHSTDFKLRKDPCKLKKDEFLKLNNKKKYLTNIFKARY